jgi:hypothetical protein
MSATWGLAFGLFTLSLLNLYPAYAEPDQQLSASSVLPGCRDLLEKDNTRNEFAQVFAPA